jgi:hypothetical protein
MRAKAKAPVQVATSLAAVRAVLGGNLLARVLGSPEALERGFTCALELAVTQKLELRIQGRRAWSASSGTLFPASTNSSRLPQTIGSKEAAAVERTGLVGLGNWLVCICEEPVLVVSDLLSSPAGIHEELKFLLNRGSRGMRGGSTSAVWDATWRCLNAWELVLTRNARTRRRTQRPTRR